MDERTDELMRLQRVAHVPTRATEAGVHQENASHSILHVDLVLCCNYSHSLELCADVGTSLTFVVLKW